MKRIWQIVILIGMSMSFQKGFGQFGMEEWPIGVIPIQYNPSFAGSMNDPRVSSNVSYSGSSSYNSLNVNIAYDQIVPALRSGIGVAVQKGTASQSNSLAGVEGAGNTDFSFAFAPKFSVLEKLSFKGKYSFSPSLGLEYSETNFRPIDDTISSSFTRYPSRKFLSSQVGLLFNSRKSYIGFSLKFLHKHSAPPNMIYPSVYTTLQLGHTFQKKPDSKFSFTPELTVVTFGLPNLNPSKTSFWRIQYILRFRYDSFLFGIAEDPRSPQFHLGWQGKSWRIMTFHHIENHERRTRSGGYITKDSYTGHLAFRYIFNQKNNAAMPIY